MGLAGESQRREWVDGRPPGLVSESQDSSASRFWKGFALKLSLSKSPLELGEMVFVCILYSLKGIIYLFIEL